MAVKTLTYVLLGKDQLSHVFRKAGDEAETSGKRIHGAFSAASLAVGGIGAAAVVGIDEAIKAARSMNLAPLQQAAKDAGIAWSQFKPKVDAADESMTKLGFSGGQTNQALLKLVTITGSSRTALASLSTVADLARYKHISLADAASALGKASTGNARVLRELGITTADLGPHFAKTGTAASRMATIVDLMNKRIGGQATAYAGTFGGKLDVLRAQIEHVEARVGLALIPVLSMLATMVANIVVPILEKFSDWFQKVGAPLLQHWIKNLLPDIHLGFAIMATGVASLIKFFGILPGPVKLAMLAIIALGIAMKLAAAANPWILLGVAIIAVVGTIVKYWGPISGFFKRVWGAVVTFTKTAFDQLELFVLVALKGVVHGLADAFGWVPFGIGSSLKKADKALGSWVKSTQARLDSLQGHKVTIGANFISVATPGGGHKVMSGYAGGTSGASSGWAWVGERGPELVNFSGGETVIPNHMVGGYADGAGLSKMGVFFKGASMAAVDKVLNSGLASLAKIFAKEIFAAGSATNVGSGVLRWAPQVLAALSMLHQDSSWLPTVLRRMNQESGGNPFAINLTDINAQHGDPSRGLMQVIMATFMRYRSFALPDDIWSPISNIFAGLNYALQRYGSLAALNRPGGYANGTSSARRGWAWVGENGPELIRFNGGERVGPMVGGRGGNTYYVNVTAAPMAHPADIGREVVHVIKEFEKGAGRGWRS